MLLSEYLHLNNELKDSGVFDPVLDSDSHFFINLQRLKQTKVPEFTHYYEKINNYFRVIIKLLDKAVSKDKKDTFYKQALKWFDFSEVNGICLGYAKSAAGAGFGKVLAQDVISIAFDIVKSGVEDPAFFELIPLFQDNVGADRLSDMIATLILDDIKSYTQRVNHNLHIDEDNYNDLQFNTGFLINPYKHDDLLLVPIDILHELPVAECWEDIEYVVSENSAIRGEMNAEVSREWKQYAATERKCYLRKNVFEKPEVCTRVLNAYKREKLTAFDPNSDLTYLIQTLGKVLNGLGYDWKQKDKPNDSYSVSIEILKFFRHWVEYNKGYDVIEGKDSKTREKILQRMIHLAAQSFIKANDLDFSCEPDEGRGPVDFKTSRGQDITVIEVKLSSNQQYLHGYETQVEEYAKAENTEKMIYVLVDVGNPGRVKTITEYHNRKVDERCKVPELVMIDATHKVSASKA